MESGAAWVGALTAPARQNQNSLVSPIQINSFHAPHLLFGMNEYHYLSYCFINPLR
jgi:hypothetical protein